MTVILLCIALLVPVAPTLLWQPQWPLGPYIPRLPSGPMAHVATTQRLAYLHSTYYH